MIDFGNYRCQANVNVATLTNCPTNQAFTMKVYSGTGSESRQYIIQEITTHNAGTKYIRACNNNNDRRLWTEWDSFITKNDLYALHTPMEGTIITNRVPSKVNTTVNSLTLEAGIYIVMANATYDSSFSGYLTNHYLTQDGKFIVTCRNSGDAGSGQCPCWIIKSTSKTTVSLVLYQGSNETRTLNKNSLIATKLA